MIILPSQKREPNVLDLSDKVKILDMLKGSMSLVEAGWCYGENKSSIFSAALNSVSPEHPWTFLIGVSWGPCTHRYPASTV
jgi:hypothetical protein